MHLHHDKHHQAYIDSANKVVADYPELQKKNLGGTISSS
jgi:superoxide dismutase